MPEAAFQDEGDTRVIASLANALSFGEVYQAGNGEAEYYPTDEAKSSGASARMKRSGVVTLLKTSGIVFLDGQDVYWDHSANKTIDWPASDRDFWIGTANGDAASTAITMSVHLNRRGSYLIDTARDGFLQVPVLTSGAPVIQSAGGWHKFVLDSTSEAQKLDLLSMIGVDPTSNWIAEFYLNCIDDGSTGAIDFTMGMANGTHASDADSITELVAFHIDGNALSVYAESDDNTTEVAATDTTYDIALSTISRFMLDGRDQDDVLFYADGVEYLNGTANLGKMTAASGPLKLLIHLEKSAAADTAVYYVSGRVRTMEQ